MASDYYYARDGKRDGPFTSVQLRDLATKGQLRPTDLIWRQGMPKWLAARSLKGLFTQLETRGNASPRPVETDSVRPPPITQPVSAFAVFLDCFLKEHKDLARGLFGLGAMVLLCGGCGLFLNLVQKSGLRSDGNYPGPNSYAEDREALRDFDRVYKPNKGLVDTFIVGINDNAATIYVNATELGLRWYKWDTATQIKIEQELGYKDANLSSIEYRLEGSRVVGKRIFYVTAPGANREQYRQTTEINIVLDEADRLK